MSLQPGKHIGPHLRLVRLLGRGAMGSVWVADHLTLQSQVAVKFMAPSMAEDQVSIVRFQQEAKAAAEIRSPHVVQVFDHGQTEDGQLYIVMEMLEGDSLDKWVRTRGALSAPVLSSVVVQACKALAKAHERGIVHRDIKPANVFVTDSGGDVFVKLLDFGVAKFSGEEAINMTAAGNMVGTPAFMSPEQLFHGRDVDHRGDLWSVAVVAYFALIGERPFEGKTLGELCVSIKNGKFKLPSELRSDLSPDVDAWFARAFHQDLGARFQTAKEMAQELERASGLSTQMSSTPSVIAPTLQTFPGTSVTSHADLPRPREARRWPFALAALVLVVVGVGVAAFMVRADAPDAAPALAAPPTTPASEPSEGDGVGDADGADDTDDANHADASAAPADSATVAPGASSDLEVEVTVQPALPATKPPQPVAPKGKPADPKGEDDRSKRAAEQLGI